MEIPIVRHDLIPDNTEFITKCQPEASYTGKKAAKYHEFFEDDETQLNLRDIGILLNEFEEFVFKKCTQTCSFCTFTYKNSQAPDQKLKIRIDKNFNVTLFANTAFLAKRCFKSSKLVKTSTGSQGRQLKKTICKCLFFYTVEIHMKKSTTKAIYKDLPLMFYDKSDFGKSFHFYVKHLLQVPYRTLAKANESSFIFDYSQSWIGAKKKSESMRSLSTFLSNTLGYLYLTLIPYSETDHFESLEIDDSKFSILNGLFIAPTAKSLFENNKEMIDGLMMDTTWKTINKYVTSILMCSSFNVGVSVGFAFGCAEDKDLYNLFIDKFKAVIGVDLTAFCVESDQGSALRSVCDEFKQSHLACLRHFKVSLKTNVFSHAICSIISCRSEFELEKLLGEYSKQFAVIEDEKEKNTLLDQLHKVGLTINANQIIISDSKTWSRVSMIERVKTRMPSTTNALEATHGHLNESTQRRNDFWPSLHRLVKSINDRTHSFQDHLKHSFQKIKRDVKNRANYIYEREMKKEIDSFSSTKTECKCGETKLESSMYRVTIPCSHMVACGAEFPSLPDVKLSVSPCWSECKFEYSITERSKDSPPADKCEKLKESIVKTIKRFSHYRNKKDIRQFVDEHFTTSDDYVNGKPLAYYSITSQGIRFFSNKLKAKKEPSESSK